jgi:hypothetical protein
MTKRKIKGETDNYSRRDIRRALNLLSQQIAAGAADPLTDAQRTYLSAILFRISKGEDANEVLGLKRRRGNSEKDETARQRLSMILHWVAGQLNPADGGQALSLAAACELAQTTIVPAAKSMFPGADDTAYDVEYLMRRWHEPAYKHLRSPLRGPYDPDFPY